VKTEFTFFQVVPKFVFYHEKNGEIQRRIAL